MTLNEKAIETAGVNLLNAERVYQEADIALQKAASEHHVAGEKVLKATNLLDSYACVRQEARAAYAKAFKEK